MNVCSNVWLYIWRSNLEQAVSFSSALCNEVIVLLQTELIVQPEHEGRIEKKRFWIFLRVSSPMKNFKTFELRYEMFRTLQSSNRFLQRVSFRTESTTTRLFLDQFFFVEKINYEEKLAFRRTNLTPFSPWKRHFWKEVSEAKPFSIKSNQLEPFVWKLVRSWTHLFTKRQILNQCFYNVPDFASTSSAIFHVFTQLSK